MIEMSCSNTTVMVSLFGHPLFDLILHAGNYGPSDEQGRDRKGKRTIGRKTREEIGKGNQMTALRFQTGV